MFVRTTSPHRTRGSYGRTALWSACLLAMAAVNASAQQGGGGGMCQGGGGRGGATGGGTGTSTTGAIASLTAGSLRRAGGLGTTGSAVGSASSALQSMQAHSALFRQSQLNALAANAQIRAETQSMWENARQRKQQALAIRQRTLALRTSSQ